MLLLLHSNFKVCAIEACWFCRGEALPSLPAFQEYPRGRPHLASPNENTHTMSSLQTRSTSEHSFVVTYPTLTASPFGPGSPAIPLGPCTPCTMKQQHALLNLSALSAHVQVRCLKMLLACLLTFSPLGPSSPITPLWPRSP